MIITKLRNIIIYVPTDSFQRHESLLCNMIKCYRIMSVLFPASPIQQLEHQSETYAPSFSISMRWRICRRIREKDYLCRRENDWSIRSRKCGVSAKIVST